VALASRMQPAAREEEETASRISDYRARTLVTGGSKGIGLAIAELFTVEGANVALCARNTEEVNKVVKSLAATGFKAWGRATDVSDPVALKRSVEDAAAELGGIDTIVCNVRALAVGNTAETWEKSFRVEMMYTVNSVAAALPFLEKSGAASIVIVSSVSGFDPAAALQDAGTGQRMKGFGVEVWTMRDGKIAIWKRRSMLRPQIKTSISTRHCAEG
jgi:nucleoside-diphosphate-sugar epimerase